MVKANYRAKAGLVEQLMFAMNGASVVDPSYDFLVAGTQADTRKDIHIGVETNEPK